MTLHLYDGNDKHLVDDDELQRITEYLSGEMSAASTAAFEQNMAADGAFFHRVAPYLKATHLRLTSLDGARQRIASRRQQRRRVAHMKRITAYVGAAAAAVILMTISEQERAIRPAPYSAPTARRQPTAAVTAVVAQRPTRKTRRPSNPVVAAEPVPVIVATPAPTIADLAQAAAAETNAFVDTSHIQILAPPTVPAPTLTFEQVQAAAIERPDPSASTPGGLPPAAGSKGFHKPALWPSWLWPFGHDD